MKIDTKLLRDGLGFIKPAIRTNAGVMDILKSVRFQLAGGVLCLTACDLVAEMEWRAEVPSTDEIDACIPGARLLGIVGLAASDIEINASKEIVSINTGIGRYRIPVRPGADMPRMRPEGDPVAEGDWTEISKEVDYVAFAASRSDTRPWIMGVNVRGNGDRIEVTASDGVGFAQATLKRGAQGLDITIPVGYTAVASQAALARFKSYGNMLVLEGENCAARICLVADKYPDISRIVGAAKKMSVKARREDLETALEMVDVARDKLPAVVFKADGKSVKIETLEEQAGAADATCDASGDSVSFGMRMDWLSHLVARADENAEFYWAGDPSKETMFCRTQHRLVGAMPYRI